MSRGLKVTFLLHAIVALVFGLLFYLAPELWARIAGYTPIDPTLTRVYGSALLGIALSSWLGFRAHHWEEVRILVEMEMAYAVLASVVMLFALLFAAAPPFIWVPLVLHVLFAVAWVYYFWRAHTAMGGTTQGPEGTSFGTPMMR